MPEIYACLILLGLASLANTYLNWLNQKRADKIATDLSTLVSACKNDITIIRGCISLLEKYSNEDARTIAQILISMGVKPETKRADA